MPFTSKRQWSKFRYENQVLASRTALLVHIYMSVIYTVLYSRRRTIVSLQVWQLVGKRTERSIDVCEVFRWSLKALNRVLVCRPADVIVVEDDVTSCSSVVARHHKLKARFLYTRYNAVSVGSRTSYARCVKAQDNQWTLYLRRIFICIYIYG